MEIGWAIVGLMIGFTNCFGVVVGVIATFEPERGMTSFWLMPRLVGFTFGFAAIKEDTLTPCLREMLLNVSPATTV